MKKVLTFGADPEAVLWSIDNERLVGASESGFPSHDSSGNKRKIREGKPVLKCDGASFTFEIETPPFTNPEAGVELFRMALTDLSNHSHHLDFFGGGRIENTSIGGHIHFSQPVDNKLTKILDATIGHLGFVVGGKNQWLRVKKGSYGKYGSVERKNYGFEYRTPPSWLISEEWTLAYLSLAYTVGHAFNEESDKCFNTILELNKLKIPKRYRLLKALDFYKKEFPHIYYGKHLSPIFRSIRTNKTWKAVYKPTYETTCLKRWKL